MKSAYELAMERMEAASGPSKKLTEKQKAKIAEINAKYDGQAAETKLSFEAKIAAAPYEDRAGLQETMAHELARIEERRTAEKDKIWDNES